MFDTLTIVLLIAGPLVGSLAMFIYMKRNPWHGSGIVDEYKIEVGPSVEFPTVLVTFKLDTGQAVGPFEFPPAYAHHLSDELCIASARTMRKISKGLGEMVDG